jgi:hypothetical protein
MSPALPGALLWNVTRHLGNGKCVILRQRVRCSVRAIRAVQNTRVFLTETRVVADNDCWRCIMVNHSVKSLLLAIYVVLTGYIG